MLDIAEQQGDIIYSENKTLARLSWLRGWNKNPRDAAKQDLAKLENQIESLGVYKPLVIYLEKDNGTVLGGNQRHRVLKELRKKYEAKGSDKYEYVWVSVVNAESDVDKIKYALSDNFSAGQYTREKLKELLKVDQPGLFADYQLETHEAESVQSFINNMAKTEEDLKLENLDKTLKSCGVPEDMIEDIKDMTTIQKASGKYNEQNLVGCGVKEFKDKKVFVMKLIFGEEQEELYKELMDKFDQVRDIFSALNGDLYERIVKVYGASTGDCIVKTMGLLATLPGSDKVKEWQENLVNEAKKKEALEIKRRADAENFLENNGRML